MRCRDFGPTNEPIHVDVKAYLVRTFFMVLLIYSKQMLCEYEMCMCVCRIRKESGISLDSTYRLACDAYVFNAFCATHANQFKHKTNLMSVSTVKQTCVQLDIVQYSNNVPLPLTKFLRMHNKN